MKELTKLANEVLARLDVDGEPDEREFDRGIVLDALKDAFDLGRRAGLTEAAGICRKTYPEMDGVQIVQLSMHCSPEECAASIEKARDA